MDVVHTLLPTLLSSAAFSSAIGYLIHKILDHKFDVQMEEHKAQLTRETETLKASLLRELEDFKGTLERRHTLYENVIETRLPAYRELWALSGRVPASGTDNIDGTTQLALAYDIREWYYQDGHGLVLSPQASRLLLAAMGTLRHAEPKNTASVRTLLSTLRTTLKRDLEVYGQDTGEEKADDSTTASKAP
jgi:hypothetical protein